MTDWKREKNNLFQALVLREIFIKALDDEKNYHFEEKTVAVNSARKSVSKKDTMDSIIKILATFTYCHFFTIIASLRRSDGVPCFEA